LSSKLPRLLKGGVNPKRRDKHGTVDPQRAPDAGANPGRVQAAIHKRRLAEITGLDDPAMQNHAGLSSAMETGHPGALHQTRRHLFGVGQTVPSAYKVVVIRSEFSV